MHSGIDEVTFSIDGATPDSYVKYRQRGDFAKAIRNLRAAVDEKRSAGRDVPFINWRYILFIAQRQRRGDGAAPATMAADIGVDRLCWELTDHPEDMFSRRFVPGTPRARGDPARDLGRQQPRQRHSGRDAARARSRSSGALAGAAARSRAPAVPCRSNDRVTNASTRPFPAQASYGRRLVRLGAQLCAADGIAHQPRLRARVAAGDALQPGASATSRSRSPRRRHPGATC